MVAIKFGSVCSGIEAASIAWEPLGWGAAWFAEIEPFPAAVLAQHWPQVPNLGDMTQIAARIDANEVEAPPVLVGGTPCQAFSVAGLRAGLSDERGQLTIKYVGLIDAIDRKRAERGERPCVAVWENVPGVLSSKDNAFGAFIGLLAGEDCELQPPGDKWSNVGYVRGPERSIAWRALDAQYFGVAQRRRRIILVTSADPRINPAKLLFEFDGVRRDIAPSRETRASIASDVGDRIANGSHWDGANNPHPTLNQCHNTGGIGASNQEIFSQRGAGLVCETQYGEELAGALTARHDSSACTDRGMNILSAYRMLGFGLYKEDETASTVKARDHKDATDLVAMSFAENTRNEIRLTNGDGQITGALTTGGGKPGQGCPTVVIAIAGNTIGREPQNGGNGSGYSEELCYTLTTTDKHAVAYRLQVRRLVPVECERLQGFPDSHTRIPWRKKGADSCPDGHRYKAIGNSMAVPVMRWIGERIDRELAALVDKTEKEQKN